jgi:hypothetical protein
MNLLRLAARCPRRYFADALLRGNRASKVDASGLQAFTSPVRKRLFVHFGIQNDHFARTGSGQT